MRVSLEVSVGMRPFDGQLAIGNIHEGMKRTQASQSVDTVDVHGARSADTLTTTPSEGQGGVDLILDPDQRIQHHGTRLVQIESV